MLCLVGIRIEPSSSASCREHAAHIIALGAEKHMAAIFARHRWQLRPCCTTAQHPSAQYRILVWAAGNAVVIGTASTAVGIGIAVGAAGAEFAD